MSTQTKKSFLVKTEKVFGKSPVPPRFSQHRDTTSIHAVIRDKTDLAKVYAEDGDVHSAARVLEDLATIVSRHAAAIVNDLQVKNV